MKKIFLLFTLVIVTLFACSKDEKEPTTISATNFTATVAENVTQGHAIGKVTASTNDATAITYSISSQSPEGSVAISTSGELTVKDASIFDYEKNQKVTGKVKLTAGEAEKTIDFVITIADDTADNIPTIAVQGITKTIAENSVSNGDVLQSLGATTTNGTLSYAIVTETPTGAVEITSAGDVKVKDASLFDYEERQTVNGSIKVSSVEFPQVAKTVDFVITITDDTADNIPTITFPDVTKRREENSVSNGDLLLAFEAKATQGRVTYSMVSSTPAGAVGVTSTGYLTVKDATAFDFEKNKKITGSVKVSSVEFPQVEETANFVITITNDPTDDINDAILSALTTSKTKYENAGDGDWVEITISEYNNLYTNLNSTTKIGVPDSIYNSSRYSNQSGEDFTLANSLGIVIPKNNYVFAVKYMNGSNKSGGLSQFKISEEAIDSGYSDFGKGISCNIIGNCYLVMKGATYKTTEVGHLAFYTPHGVIFRSMDTPSDAYYERGNSNTLGNIDNAKAVYLFQGIATSEKQW